MYNDTMVFDRFLWDNNCPLKVSGEVPAGREFPKGLEVHCSKQQATIKE